MNGRRVAAVARRVASQFRRDHRTIGLLLGAPILVLALVGALWGSGAEQVTRVVVATSPPVPAPVVDALRRVEPLQVSTDTPEGAMQQLRDGKADAVVAVRVGVVRTEFVVTLEGSDPLRTGSVLGAIQKGILAATGGAPAGGSSPLQVEYLYGGPDRTLLDHLAPLFIAFFAFFFTFLLSAVSFLRERTTGTLERLLATPLRRAELVIGYLLGFGLFALIQAAVIIGFTIWGLRVQYQGSLATVFVIEAMVVVVAVSIGLFVSAFARTELQAIQFIPLVVLPQAFLSGFLVPVDQLSDVLRPFAVIMPLTYAMEALRAVMIKGFSIADPLIVRDLLVLAGFGLLTSAGAIASIRREVA
ncbi:MAG: ABC transporter permease [Chloroflexi bacterium]|nr:ABC transporter permease [Chloroflexota bacterium]